MHNETSIILFLPLQGSDGVVLLELVSGSLSFTYAPDGQLTEESVVRGIGVNLIDGNNHNVAINIQSEGAVIIVDSFACGVACFGNIPLFTDITLGEPFTFGGGVNMTSLLSVFIESSSSFVGCMEAIVINGNTLQYGDILSQEGVTPGCNRTDCNPESCLNGGTCQDLWFATTCDCLSGYSGPRCEVLSQAYFPGGSFAVISNLLSLLLSLEWSTAAQQGTVATLVEVRLKSTLKGCMQYYTMSHY